MHLGASDILAGFWLYGLLGLPLLIAALYLVFFAATVLTARLERVFVHEWRPLENSAAPALDPYHQEMDRQAAALGYRWQAVAKQVKNEIDQWSSLWLSPDGYTALLPTGICAPTGRRNVATGGVRSGGRNPWNQVRLVFPRPGWGEGGFPTMGDPPIVPPPPNRGGANH